MEEMDIDGSGLLGERPLPDSDRPMGRRDAGIGAHALQACSLQAALKGGQERSQQLQCGSLLHPSQAYTRPTPCTHSTSMHQTSRNS